MAPSRVEAELASELAKPFMVQAHRPGQHTQWFTDKRFADLADATAHAVYLHQTYGRKVRILDQQERVLGRLPLSARMTS